MSNRFFVIAAAMLITAMAFHGGSAFSSQSFLSKATVVRTASTGSLDSSRTVFDVVVSLHNFPSGDNNPEVDGPGEYQTTYERIIEHWADGVCEQSNGAHRLGKVRIFLGGKAHNVADVLWNESEHPRAHPSGFGDLSRQIFFGDVFPSVSGSADKDMLGDPVGAGYTLAHEWGHYVYGLYDEYRGDCSGSSCSKNRPQAEDVATDRAIMNNHWAAKSGNYEWLNHSTSSNFSLSTAQGRMFGKSAWEILVQPTNQDPDAQDTDDVGTRRLRYLELVPVRPGVADEWFKIELAGANTCRDDLDIMWIVDDVELEIVMDTSGSMRDEQRLDNAKRAASTLIDILPSGTALGILGFNSRVYTVLPITVIPNAETAVQDDAKRRIGALTANGDTAFYDAAALGAEELAEHGDSGVQLVFALTDGEDNRSSLSSDDAAAYIRSVDVSLTIFGYGDNIPDSTLRSMAARTGGEFHKSPTTLAEIQGAFLGELAKFTETALIQQASMTAPAGELASISAVADPTLSSVNIVVALEGGLDVTEVSVFNSAGDVIVGADGFTCQMTGRQSSCIAGIDGESFGLLLSGNGEFRIQVRNLGGVDLPATVTITGSPKRGVRKIDLSLSEKRGDGQVVAYPHPMIIVAAASQDGPITSIDVAGELVEPSGNVRPVAFRDDGGGGDAISGDGFYTSVIPYEANGLHEIRVVAHNQGGSGRFTHEGTLWALPEDGIPVTPAPPPALGFDFQRTASLQLTVEGFASDDLPSAPPGCARVNDQNWDVAARIDFPGDVDCFSFSPSLASGDVIRVSGYRPHFEPVVKLIGSDGSEIRSLMQGNAGTVNGYLAAVMTDDDLDMAPLHLTVAGQGDAEKVTYHVNRGADKFGDELVNAPPVSNAGEDVSQQEGTVVTLDGSGSSDSDGQVVTYAWRQTDGPQVTLADSDSATASFTAPMVDASEILVFELMVTDDDGAFAFDSVSVTVENNEPPIADAGPDQRVDERRSVTLDGSGSSDDREVSTYSWKQITGSEVSLAGADSVQATFTAPSVDADRTLTFELTVADDVGVSATDEVAVTVANVDPPPERSKSSGGWGCSIATTVDAPMDAAWLVMAAFAVAAVRRRAPRLRQGST